MEKLKSWMPKCVLITGLSFGQIVPLTQEIRLSVSEQVNPGEGDDFVGSPKDGQEKQCPCDCPYHKPHPVERKGYEPHRAAQKPAEPSEDELLLMALKKSPVDPELFSLDESSRVLRWMERFEGEYQDHVQRAREERGRKRLQTRIKPKDQDIPAELGIEPEKKGVESTEGEDEDPMEAEFRSHNIRQSMFHGWKNILTRIDRKLEKSQLKIVYEIMKDEGLDESHLFLVHQALIESHWQWDAKSPVGATGYWQFMPATARDMGLVVDENMDQRMWLKKSTRAAIRYLKWLYKQTYRWDTELGRLNQCVEIDYSDPRRWAFAMSSYNRGPHNVKGTYEAVNGDAALYPVKMRDRYMETRNRSFLESASYVNKVAASRKALLAFEIRRRLWDNKICLDTTDQEEALEYLMSLNRDE